MSLRRVAHCVAAAIAACAGDCAAAAVASGDCDAFGDCATDDVSALLTFQRPEARRGLPRLRWERPAPWWRMGPPSLTSGFQKCEMGERRWGCAPTQGGLPGGEAHGDTPSDAGFGALPHRAGPHRS